MSRYVIYDKIYQHMDFKLKSEFSPTGDQPQAIEKLLQGLNEDMKHQVLLGVTGSGKTFTMANVIDRRNQPALIISHNKTLAAQLYQEFRDFFPENAVSYFVSYYDYYQPESYIPKTDTYIEKETDINEEIDKLRLAATTNLMTRKDTIIVASVSCIYNIGSPEEYANFVLPLSIGLEISREVIINKLIRLQYERSNFDFKRSTFRIRGDYIDIYPAYEDAAVRLFHNGERILKIVKIDAFSGKVLSDLSNTDIYPAKHYMMDANKSRDVFGQIRNDLKRRVNELTKDGKKLEAYRLSQRVNYDLEMIEEIGYVNGIENYSRYFDGRKPGDSPFSLLDYFKKPYNSDWLLFIDESHITIPQIRGMYNGDRSRKQTLVDFGFRLPAALDNRPLTFTEFMQRAPQTIYVSATPNPWEISISQTQDTKIRRKIKHTGIVEQLIRPTGILDPVISVRPSQGQILDLVREILIRKPKKERVLVTTLTKRMAEELTTFLNEKKYADISEFSKKKIKDYPTVQYLHADIETLERSDILDDLRLGKYDVLVGINLLREGLDLPEVSLVVILDADKEGFLRSDTSLVQTMGRAARHINSKVILYADRITNSMKRAINEVNRRRKFQEQYNTSHHINPSSIKKLIREKLIEKDDKQKKDVFMLNEEFSDQMLPIDKITLVNKLRKQMIKAANELNFELAANIRDRIKQLNTL